MEELQTTFFGSKCIKQRYKLSTKYDEEPSDARNAEQHCLQKIILARTTAWQ